MNDEKIRASAGAALFEEATSALAIGDLEAAASLYQASVDQDPSFFEGWHALGMTLMKLERYDEAITAGIRATELSPNDQLAWSSLSLFYVRNHQIAEAEAAGVKAKILSWGGKIAPSTGDQTSTIK